LPALPGVTWRDLAVRGFPFGATVASAKAFREQADRLFAAAPVQSLVVRRLTPRTVREVAASPYLARLSHLTLSGRLGDEGVAALLASPHLHRLEALALRGTRVADAGAAALAAADTIPNLTFLDLDDNDIGDAGAFALAASPHLRKVKHLGCIDNPFGPAADQALERRFGDRYAFLHGLMVRAAAEVAG
jgi:Leucine Rich repeat